MRSICHRPIFWTDAMFFFKAWVTSPCSHFGLVPEELLTGMYCQWSCNEGMVGNHEVARKGLHPVQRWKIPSKYCGNPKLLVPAVYSAHRVYKGQRHPLSPLIKRPEPSLHVIEEQAVGLRETTQSMTSFWTPLYFYHTWWKSCYLSAQCAFQQGL